MIDISILASQALSASLPFIEKGAEQLTETVGKDIWGIIKSKFTSDTQRKAIKELEENPKNEVLHNTVTAKLEGIIEADQKFMKELLVLLSKKSEPKIKKSKSQIIKGTDIIVVEHVRESQITISKK